MKKTTLLNTAIAATLLAGSASVTAVEHTGDLGDSRIHYPLADATITEAATDVWFVAALDADFYTIDLRAYDENAGCGHPETGEDANTTHITEMFRITDPALDCGNETVGTLSVTGYYDKNDSGDNEDDEDGEADFHLCKWRTPDLPNGNYQIAVNSIKLGHHSVTETRFNCKSDAALDLSALTVLTMDTTPLLAGPTSYFLGLGLTAGINAASYDLEVADQIGRIDRQLKVGEDFSNKHRDPSTYFSFSDPVVSTYSELPKYLTDEISGTSASILDGFFGGFNDALVTANIDLTVPSPSELLSSAASVEGDKVADMNYQKFKIAVPENPPEGVTIVDHPMDPIVIEPVHETPLAGREEDVASRVKFLDPSPANRAADWYELWISTDDTNERLMDLESNPSYNNWYKLIVDSSELLCTQRAADNGRICTIEVISPTIALATPGTKFNWWVRGWNEEFQEEETEDGNGWSDKGTFIADDNTDPIE